VAHSIVHRHRGTTLRRPAIASPTNPAPAFSSACGGVDGSDACIWGGQQGVGRGWTLPAGERGHYELAAGCDPLPYLEAMTAMTNPGGMLPEKAVRLMAVRYRMPRLP
jgi:hypothetical protein